MRQYTIPIFSVIVLLFSGCTKDLDYLNVIIDTNGLSQEITVLLPSEIKKGTTIDLYWKILESSDDIDRVKENHVSAVYDGKQVVFTVYPWSDLSISEFGNYTFRAEVFVYYDFREKMSKRSFASLTPPIIPVVDKVEFENGKISLIGQAYRNIRDNPIIEHGFYIGYVKMYFSDFDADILKENYQKVVLDKPLSDFSYISDFIPESSRIYVYAYVKTHYGELFSASKSYRITNRIKVSTMSDFKDLTHEKATVSGSAYLEKNELGLSSIKERGFCYINTRQITSGRMPNINDGRLILEGGEGVFSGTITGLSPGAAYKVCAYAINSFDEVFYASSYVTLPMYLSSTFVPKCMIYTDYTDDPNATGVVVLKGEVIQDYGYYASERGFCYTTDGSTPTIADKKIPSGEGLGVFSETISGLPPGTYTFKAYGINSAGIGYSSGYYQVKIK